MKFLSLGIFGLLGVFTRYIIDAKFSTDSLTFPISTFSINMVGCLIAGATSYFFHSRDENFIVLGILVGFCGGLTTFSGYSLQTLNLFAQEFSIRSWLYFVISPIAGLMFAFLGYHLSLLVASSN